MTENEQITKAKEGKVNAKEQERTAKKDAVTKGQEQAFVWRDDEVELLLID